MNCALIMIDDMPSIGCTSFSLVPDSLHQLDDNDQVSFWRQEPRAIDIFFSYLLNLNRNASCLTSTSGFTGIKFKNNK